MVKKQTPASAPLVLVTYEDKLRLSYKIGQLKIRELRAKAESELGHKFKIAEFHDQILSAGNIPLSVLENKIMNWIAIEKLKK